MTNADAVKVKIGAYLVYKYDEFQPEYDAGNCLILPARQAKRRVTAVWLNATGTILRVRVRVVGKSGNAWIGLDDWSKWKDPKRDPSQYVFVSDVESPQGVTV